MTKGFDFSMSTSGDLVKVIEGEDFELFSSREEAAHAAYHASNCAWGPLSTQARREATSVEERTKNGLKAGTKVFYVMLHAPSKREGAYFDAEIQEAIWQGNESLLPYLVRGSRLFLSYYVAELHAKYLENR
jgi:hypothetical protein